MSLNDAAVLHEPLGAPKKHHHHGGGRRFFSRSYDIPWWYYLPPETSSVDDEVAFHEAKHDIVIVSRAGGKPQIRQAVVDRLKARGWVESTKNDLVLLSPPGLVAAMKGLGIIHGLGQITPEPLLQPVEIVGVGVGGAMVIGGVVAEGKLGLILGIVGGMVGLLAGGSALIRALKSHPAAASPVAPGGMPSPIPAQAAALGPPPPPPKPTSQQRLQQAVQAYGPLAAQLVSGVIKLF